MAEKQTEVEFAGVKFRGGKLFVIITALTTLGGGLYASFEFYKDYMNMKEKIEQFVSPDLSDYDKRIAVMNEQFKILETQSVYFSKQIELYEGEIILVKEIGEDHYTSIKDLKNSMREDINRQEKIIDDVEDEIAQIEDNVRGTIDIAEQRFENKRDSLQNDYDAKADTLRTSVDQKIGDLEARISKKMETMQDELNTKLQRSLDNPLANN
jgi:DNA anti-recombination protein RmuC